MSNEIVKASESSLIPDASNLKLVAKELLASGLFKFKHVAEVFAVVEYGREMGLAPVASLNSMAVISGRLTMEAKTMLAIARNKAGVSWKVDNLTKDGCKMTFTREGFADPITVEFTMAEAREAELVKPGGAWTKYPKDMLFARCSSRGVRQIAPDAVLGLYSSEEMRDVEVTGSFDEGVKKAKPKPKPKPKATPEEIIEDISTPLETGAEDKEEDIPDAEVVSEDEEKEAALELKAFKEGEKEEESGISKVQKTLVDAIKQSLEALEVEAQPFKAWLYDYQFKKNRRYVRKIGKNFSFTMGEFEDLKHLHSELPHAVSLYRQQVPQKSEW